MVINNGAASSPKPQAATESAETDRAFVPPSGGIGWGVTILLMTCNLGSIQMVSLDF